MQNKERRLAYDENIVIYSCSLFAIRDQVRRVFYLIDGAESRPSISDWEQTPNSTGTPSFIISQKDYGKNMWSEYIYAYSKYSFKTEAEALAYSKELLASQLVENKKQ
jgi:hypothetical protein